MDLPLKQIAENLELTESDVKNRLYRTKKEVVQKFKEGGDLNAR